jgi:hypothetical protein
MAARRELDRREFEIFKLHMLQGLDQAACCRRLGMSEGDYWHAVYRIQRRLGKAFTESGLLPDSYFGGYRYKFGFSFDKRRNKGNFLGWPEGREGRV